MTTKQRIAGISKSGTDSDPSRMRRNSSRLMCGAGALTALLIMQPALAQELTSAAEAETAAEAIVVTGSRIRRDGFEAPTPVAVIGEEAIQTSAQPNVADYVNTMPILSGSSTPGNSQASVSSGAAGINVLNLRGLGGARTLVLLDGRRSVSSTITGLVDVNTIPQALISRVEIVTGGASAAYGSDAVSGVVNFILDRKFTGIKGELSGGITTYGDNENLKASLALGTSFADGRGHFLLGGDVTWKAGILKADRAWNRVGWGTMQNPAYTATNGEPERLVLPEIGGAYWSQGSLISSGPLRGTAFGPGGAVYNYNYGDLVSGQLMRGGEWKASEVRTYKARSIDSRQDMQSLFGRGSFDFVDNLTGFFEASYNRAKVTSQCCPNFDANNISVSVNNAFLPDAVRQNAIAAGATTLRIGTMHPDLPVITTENTRQVWRFVGGFEGELGLFGRRWKWDAYYQWNQSRNHELVPQTYLKDRMAQAIDAVRDPATGTIVCRSTLTNPNDGCVPYNVFGLGVNSQAAIDYVVPGLPLAPWRKQILTQQVAAASMSGNLFALPAGDVAVSFGLEHRRESVRGTADAMSATRNFLVGNFLPSFGNYSVTEGFLEAVVPIADQDSAIGALEFNGAVRGTDYSTSGFVTTWKLGATYRPIPDILLRATYSRDIRAPNLAELFQAGSAVSNSVLDPFNGNVPTAFLSVSTGNPALQPEKAKTLGLGIVVQPRFIPGLSASFDYFDIDIKDAIGSVAAQQIMNFCFEGNQTFCSAITRGLNNTGVEELQEIRVSPFNTTQLLTRGYDIELAYQLAIGKGQLSFRGLATHVLKALSDNGINAPDDAAGAAVPKWRYNATLAYRQDAFRASVSAYGRSKGKQDNDWIACRSGCPTSNSVNVTITDNVRDSTFYLGSSLSYDFLPGFTAFFNISNLLNADPARQFPGPGSSPYDILIGECADGSDCQGRTFRFGVRFKL